MSSVPCGDEFRLEMNDLSDCDLPPPPSPELTGSEFGQDCLNVPRDRRGSDALAKLMRHLQRQRENEVTQTVQESKSAVERIALKVPIVTAFCAGIVFATYFALDYFFWNVNCSNKW